MRAPRLFWRLIHLGPRVVYALGLGPIIGRFVLLLTTFGRKTGLPRVTPLTFEDLGDTIYLASARGPVADWYRNILSNPRVSVRLGRRRFQGTARAITDPEAIAQYLERQLGRNPRAFGAILRSEGLPFRPSHERLVRFAPNRPMVEIRPIVDAA